MKKSINKLKYKVQSQSKDNQGHEYSLYAINEEDAKTKTLKFLNKIKGWSHHQYKVVRVELINE